MAMAESVPTPTGLSANLQLKLDAAKKIIEAEAVGEATRPGPILQVSTPPRIRPQQKPTKRPLCLLDRSALDVPKDKLHNESTQWSTMSKATTASAGDDFLLWQDSLASGPSVMSSSSEFTLGSRSGFSGASTYSLRLRACPGNASSLAREWAISQSAAAPGSLKCAGRPSTSGFLDAVNHRHRKVKYLEAEMARMARSRDHGLSQSSSSPGFLSGTSKKAQTSPSAENAAAGEGEKPVESGRPQSSPKIGQDAVTYKGPHGSRAPGTWKRVQHRPMILGTAYRNRMDALLEM
eukprot:TRINITY_DN83539_c0_g1_i1.p1 TRINITY_DN83539_c0_g1~~TRINITY_DN83539_c0_g1_i1.p1  ORF type:complete len:293 (+),score=42.45 TRINITY_DN83539_c0_g1_i1:83-961(+)